jgi:hypothetical protein
VRGRYLSIAAVTIGLAITVVIGSLSDHDHHAPPSNDVCGVARFHLNQASQFSNVFSYRDAYDAALLGLKANRTCNDRSANLVNEGYLLSTKAIAEYYLKKGDSSADLNHAIELLERCREMAPRLGRAVSDLCEKQEQSDTITRGRLQEQSIIITRGRLPTQR